MCELAKLPMVICSETIETVSLSGALKVCNSPHTSTFINRYKNRKEHLNLSLHQYFHAVKNAHIPTKIKKEYIPHYVGGSGQPIYPISNSYARVELLKHKPWNKSVQICSDEDYISKFEQFRSEDDCPSSVKLNCERAKLKFELLKRGIQEVIAPEREYSNSVEYVEDDEVRDVLHASDNLLEMTNALEELENSGFDFGKNYNWSKRHYKVSKRLLRNLVALQKFGNLIQILLNTHQTPRDGESWLLSQIDKYSENKHNKLRIPLKKNGKKYKLKHLNNDQFKIAFIILSKIKEWIDLEHASKEEKKRFKPLRMTVLGCAGSGKSVLINTLVGCIRKMFNNNNSVLVTAPTGAAAYNVGGQTIHREFCVNTGKKHENLGKVAKENLVAKLMSTIALFFDERSLISQVVLGSAEMNISSTAHNSGHESEDWGGIPVVVIFGDDYQLPPPFGGGATDVLFNQGNSHLSRNGAYHFLKLASETMELVVVMRQNEKNKEFRELLKKLRVGEPDIENVETVMSLHLNNNNFSFEQVEEIKQKATFIFANRKYMEEHNREKLRDQHSTKNPVARIQTTTVKNGVRYKGVTKCFKKDYDIDPILNICRGAKVQISGKNFEPDWGLFNGAVGSVKEIVYNTDGHPLDGTLPKYVIVHFPHYCGPSWFDDHPKWVPIPPIELNCQKHCCKLMYLPLSLAYSKTGHTFQGQNVGPEHAIPCIVVQPGTLKMEHLCPGLLYMFLSRATTIGTKEDRSQSAIFFITNDLTRERVQRLLHTKQGKLCTFVERRTAWIKYLHKHLVQKSFSKKEKEDIIYWAENVQISSKTVQSIIEDSEWRESNSLNY